MGGAAGRASILTGSIGWGMVRFGAPIALAMGLQTTFNLVDAFLISRLEPSVAGPSLGALGICDQIAAIGTIVSYGVTLASTALVSQAFGRGDQPLVRRVVWQSLLAVAALSVVFSLGFGLLARPIIVGVVGAKGEVARLGVSYLRVSAGGAFTMYFLLQLTGIQRALGSSKIPVALLIVSNVINLLLAVLLIYGDGASPDIFAWARSIARTLHVPRLELLGAAWATILARGAVLVVVVVILLRLYDAFSRASATWPDKRTLKTIGSLAWPSSVQLVIRMLAMLLTQTLVARAFTTPTDQSATTALGIVFRLETMVLFVSMGWGSAAQTFVAQNLGAGRPDRAMKSGWVAASATAVMMLGIAVAYRVEGERIIAFFDDDPDVLRAGVSYLRTISYSYVGLGGGIVLGGAITGSGAARTALFVDLAVVLALQMPACVIAVVAPGATIERLWETIAATYFVSGIAYVLVFRYSRWVESGQSLIDHGGALGPRDS